MIVYRHRRLDTYEVFYVGIGKTEKRAYQKSKRNKYWTNIVNKHGYIVEIIATPNTWEEACELEMLLISEYGRKDQGKGNLVNMTDGGDGALGKLFSKETRQKLSKFRKGKKHSKESIQKMRIVKKCLSQDTKNKMSKSQKGKYISEDTKLKISYTLRGKNAKVTYEQAYNIKYNHKDLTPKEIAFLYKINRTDVYKIMHGKTWKYI